jgi:CHAT domain-containing protein
MVALHRKLRGKARVTKDEALRQAMIKVHARQRWSHPYHWASFLLIGDPANGGLARR